MADPYAGAETNEERQAIYQRLLEQYAEDTAAYPQAESEWKDKVRAGWMEHWNHYRKIQLHENKEFYKYVGLYAAGAFGISFAFIDNIIPFAAALYKPVLVAGWACLAVTLIINVAIHLVSGFVHGAFCDTAAKNIELEYEKKQPLPIKLGLPGYLTGILYILEFIGFMGGIVCLVAFVFLNK